MLNSPCPTTATTTSQQNFEIIHRTSHALEHVAGPWSQRIAELIPFPHSDFLERSAAWMHVTGMIVSNPVSSDQNILVAIDHIQDWREAAFLGSPHFNSTNVSILKKMALPLWQKTDYRQFASLLSCPHSVKIMKHSDAVTPKLVRILSAVPGELRRQKIVRFLVHENEGKLLCRLFRGGTEPKIRQLKFSLEKCRDREHFFKNVGEHFSRQFEAIPAGPVIADERFKPILNARDLERTGLKFRNCLKSYRVDALAGENGFYVFFGSEKAVISYLPRIDGSFIVDEILGPNNDPVSTETLAEIRSVLAEHGFQFRDTHPAWIHQEIGFTLNRLGSQYRADTAGRTAMKAIEKLSKLERTAI